MDKVLTYLSSRNTGEPTKVQDTYIESKNDGTQCFRSLACDYTLFMHKLINFRLT